MVERVEDARPAHAGKAEHRQRADMRFTKPRLKTAGQRRVREQRIEVDRGVRDRDDMRSEEHTSELQSLMRISYAVFCLKKKTKQKQQTNKNSKKNEQHTQHKRVQKVNHHKQTENNNNKTHNRQT